MTVVIDGTNGITTPDVESSGPVSGTNFSYTGTLTGGTGVVNLGSGQFYKDASGNVGIGTASPTQKLQLSGAGSQYASVISTNSGNTGVLFGDASKVDEGYVLYGNSDNALKFGANGSERMQIDSAGNVGIGTSSPGQKLDVNGIIRNQIEIRLKNDANNVSYVTFEQNASTGSETYIQGDGRTAGRMSFYTANAERARIDSSGSLLVGTTSASVGGVSCAQVLDARTRNSGYGLGIIGNASHGQVMRFAYEATAVGSINITGSSTSFTTSSDYRLKHDIAPMTGALAKVAALKPCTYKWNVDDSNGEGFIAHELQEVVPDAVTGEKDAVDAEGNPQYQGIDTSFLVATLTAAIQEQQAIIESLTARVVALEGQA
jgi:hypothetical protein